MTVTNAQATDLLDPLGKPIYSESAELNVIGAILQGGQKVLDALDDSGFNPADFYIPRHETVYRMAMEMSAAGEPVDVGSVCMKFGRDIPKIGGNEWLLEAWDSRAIPSSAPFYAKKVTQHAVVRRLVGVGMQIVQQGSMADIGDYERLLDVAQAHLQDVVDSAQGRAASDDDMGAALDEFMERLEAGGPPATETGIRDIDRLFVGGLQAGTLTTVAARPGVGKTVMGLQIALNVAFNGGNVGYTTLEMVRGDLLTRGAACAGRVDYGRLQKSPREQLTEGEWRSVRRAVERIRDSGLLVSNRTSVNVSGIRSDIRSMIRRKGSCAAWVVDYLGLVTPTDGKVIREQQVAGMTRALKQTSLETGVPVVMLCQLNREGEKSGRPPVMTDLRESGSIEQDSDGVLLLHRDPDKTPDVLGGRVAKNRRGACGEFELTFEGSYQAVSEGKWTPHGALDRENVRAIR